MVDHNPTVGFIGAGTVGTALALCLARAQYRVVGVWSRGSASVRRFVARVAGAQACPDAQAVADTSDLVFITVPDDAIAQAASAVHWRSGQMVVHCSGALSLNVLEPAARAGAHAGTFHPLQSFATVEQAQEALSGSTVALEGDKQSLDLLEQVAHALNVRTIRLEPGQKVLYHVAAVFASNYLVTLTAVAARLWQELGLDSQAAIPALSPLMRGTLSSVEAIGIPDCLTGPVARGDVDTVRSHLEALALRAPNVLPAYRDLAVQTIPIAEAKGSLLPSQAERLRELIAEASAGAG